MVGCLWLWRGKISCCFQGFIYSPIRLEGRKLGIFFGRLKPFDEIPWLVLGDFNEILDLSEKVGGRNRIERQMESFREALSDYASGDLGFRGGPFTWCHNREGNQRIWE